MDNLARRSLRSVTWISLANLVSLPVNFVQAILLARLLAVEYFGIFAAMNSVVALSGIVFEFGLGNAFLHRSRETEDAESAAAVLFTLRLIFDTAWLVSFSLVAWVAFDGLSRLAALVLLASAFGSRLAATPRLLLVRRVEHRRLAILDLCANLGTTLVSLLVAFLSHSIWALLVSSLVAALIYLIGFYLIRPPWKPRLVNPFPALRYFLGFGGRNLANSLLDSAIENIDNLYAGYFLGSTFLGYYSRAFKFAIYPRTLLGTPLGPVALGAYTELKSDRPRLGRAFFLTNAFLVRGGFLLAGWLALIAPQFIRLLIGEKWLPMLDAFRLMLLFSLLDPIKNTIASVLVALGAPEKITRVRLVQLGVLLAGLFTLGSRLQIAGVALSLDLMILAGTALSLALVRRYIEVPYAKLFGAPALALGIAVGLALAALRLLAGGWPDLWSAALATLVFGTTYLAGLWALEGGQLRQWLGELANFAPALRPLERWLQRRKA